MAQVLVRDVEQDVLDRLKERARRSGRSLEAELRQLMKQAAGSDRESFAVETTRIRGLFDGRTFADSSDLVRADRDR